MARAGVHPGVPQRLVDQPRRPPAPQAAAAPRRADEDLPADPGPGPDHRAPVPVLPERAREGGDRRRARQPRVRQAAQAARAAGQPRGPAGHADAQPARRRGLSAAGPLGMPGGRATLYLSQARFQDRRAPRPPPAVVIDNLIEESPPWGRSVSTVCVASGEAGRGCRVISSNALCKPISAESKRTDFALAA
ncbi:hypothetical protein MICRO80W_110060 [Micrococcus luteus]|nr:hypothetical protein MICRO80W_110060 [Micrococcus luteus]